MNANEQINFEEKAVFVLKGPDGTVKETRAGREQPLLARIIAVLKGGRS